MRKTGQLLATALILTWAVAGCTKKSSNPLSPTVAGPIGGVSITAPKPLEPLNQATMPANAPVTLLFESATTTGERPITQELQVALDADFTQRVHSAEKLAPGPNGRTSYTLPVLAEGKGYFWRVRAVDGANTGPYSAPSIFSIALTVRIETPVPLSPVRRESITGVTPTLVVQNTAFTGTSGVMYRFELGADQGFSKVLAIWTVPRSGGDQTQVTGSGLAPGTEYYWRVSATDGSYVSPYSIVQAFKTEAPKVPDPPPTPDPPTGGGGGGGGGPWPTNGNEVVAWANRNYPDRLAAGVSGEQRRANMEFLRDRMIEAGICGGMQLGRNLKRGGPELSVDFLTEMVGGRWHGIDIAHDYDNTGIRMVLTWADTGPDNGVFHSPYNGSLPCR